MNSERPVNWERPLVLALTVWSLVDAIGALGALSLKNGRQVCIMHSGGEPGQREPAWNKMCGVQERELL